MADLLLNRSGWALGLLFNVIATLSSSIAWASWHGMYFTANSAYFLGPNLDPDQKVLVVGATRYLESGLKIQVALQAGQLDKSGKNDDKIIECQAKHREQVTNICPLSKKVFLAPLGIGGTEDDVAVEYSFLLVEQKEVNGEIWYQVIANPKTQAKLWIRGVKKPEISFNSSDTVQKRWLYSNAIKTFSKKALDVYSEPDPKSKMIQSCESATWETGLLSRQTRRGDWLKVDCKTETCASPADPDCKCNRGESAKACKEKPACPTGWVKWRDPSSGKWLLHTFEIYYDECSSD